MRLLTALCVAAVVVAFAVPALAETQNIKVSGDISVAHVYQHDIDLNDSCLVIPCPVSEEPNENNNETFFIQQVGLNVEADLTDNVSTYIRIINERAWDASEQAGAVDQARGTTYNPSNEAFDITLDEAYLTLKEMLYAPLTLKIGRQNIWLGKGLMIGNAGIAVWDTQNALPPTIREVSDATAFDAIRATLDYDPWTIDLIYAKMDENNVNIVDDVDLYVANVGYQFTEYDAEAEAYYILEDSKGLRVPGTAGVESTNKGDTNETHTIGLRGSFVPYDNMNIWAEGAVQAGKYASTTREEDREAYALNVGADYTFTDVRYTPKLGAEYLYASGEGVDDNGNPTGDWEAWNPLYRGKFDNYIADFRNLTKITDYDFVRGVSANANNNGVTNNHQVALFGSLNPMTDVTFDTRVAFFWFDEKPLNNVKDDIGTELDAKLTYDYTEDVEFTLCAGVFWPGKFYPSSYVYTPTGGNSTEISPDQTAAQVVSAVKVEF